MNRALDVERVVGKLRSHAPAGIDLAIVLGSGLGEAAALIQGPEEIPLSLLPGFPQAGVAGHGGKIVLGKLGGVRALVFKGRSHYYERGSVREVLAPVQVARGLGAKVIVLTNAAGGIRRDLSPGDLMLIEDHLNFTFLGLPSAMLGEFRGTKQIYDPTLLAGALQVSRQLGINLHRGVYAGVLGPSYETAAEVAMLSRIGADAVGMSTVLEAEEASRNGQRVLGLSLISNLATGTSKTPHSHDEVTQMAGLAAEQVGRLLEGLGRALGEVLPTGETMS